MGFIAEKIKNHFLQNPTEYIFLQNPIEELSKWKNYAMIHVAITVQQVCILLVLTC